jgi:hypothetical protein
MRFCLRFLLKEDDQLRENMRSIESGFRPASNNLIQENCMSTTSAITTMPASSPKAILWAGLIAGTMDITAAFVVYGLFGANPVGILQGIASGLLGPRAYEGGAATAVLGLICHFTIAYGAATVFFLLSRHMPFLTRQFILAGVLYGIVVYFFMARVVLPLSRVQRGPFRFKMMIIGIIIHIFCIGLPISTIVKRFSGEPVS